MLRAAGDGDWAAYALLAHGRPPPRPPGDPMCLLASSRLPAWPPRPPAFDVLLGQLGAYQVPRKVRNRGPLQLAFLGLRTLPRL